MNQEGKYKALLHEVKAKESTVVTIGGIPVSIQMLDKYSKLALSASVYEGGNYIPQSVRKCLTQKKMFPFATIKTFLRINEVDFNISLHYIGPADLENGYQLKDVIEEFTILADEWRLYLDEHDRHDLIHVRTK
jgi:hypothetical protein